MSPVIDQKIIYIEQLSASQVLLSSSWHMKSRKAITA